MPSTAPDTGLPPVRVVAGVIHARSGNRVLIARRPTGKHQGGLWEFPGGKIEPGETPAAALARELAEELAIAVDRSEPFLVIEHRYPDRLVVLDVWRVLAFTGVAVGNEGQEIAWVPVGDLAQRPFPAANQPIIAALCGADPALIPG
ncbi:MAG: 8-oxo-dGTP diphosphatase MutT [Porticoccaceae bacterium]